MREVRGAVNRIDDPSMTAVGRRCRGGGFLAEHGVRWKSIRDQFAEAPLDLEVGCGHEIDGAFLLDREVGPKVSPLNTPCDERALNRCGEKQGIRGQSTQL